MVNTSPYSFLALSTASRGFFRKASTGPKTGSPVLTTGGNFAPSGRSGVVNTLYKSMAQPTITIVKKAISTFSAATIDPSANQPSIACRKVSEERRTVTDARKSISKRVDRGIEPRTDNTPPKTM